MSTSLDLFNQYVSGSSDQDIDISPIILSSGDFTRLVGIDTVLNSWNTILNIPVGTYDHDPMFGSDILKYLFEPMDEKNITNIQTSVESSLMDNDDRATITDIEVQILPGRKGIVLAIYVVYNGEEATLSTTVMPKSSINVS